MKDKAKYSAGQQQQTVFFQQSPDLLTIRVNPKLITTAINAGYLTELAFYYFLRHHHKFSRISTRHGNPKGRISRLTGLSMPTINKYFRVLSYHGLVKQDRNGYQLTTTSINKRYKIHVSADANVSEIKRLIYLTVLREDGIHQSFVNTLESYITEKQQVPKLSELKTLKTSFRPYLSIRYATKLLNISSHSVIKLFRDLNYQRLIRTTDSDAELICAAAAEDVKHLDGTFSHKFVKNGLMFAVAPARHDFLMQPIVERPMTLQRYKRVTKDANVRRLVNHINKTLIN